MKIRYICETYVTPPRVSFIFSLMRRSDIPPTPMRISDFTDREIVEALLGRNRAVTEAYLYRKCYPLFKSIFDRYYTDCENCAEFINEIYLFVMTPRRATGRSKLADFGFRCTLTQWLKIVAEHYCHHLFSRRMEYDENIFIGDDRFTGGTDSLDADVRSLDMHDLSRILESMPNERYRRLIVYRYLDQRSNEETAELLSLTMANFYNIHLRAKKQFCDALRKEGLI